MSILVQILTMVAAIAPYLKKGEAIMEVITTLQSLISTATAEVKAVWPQVQDIIAVLRSNDAITQEQLDALDKIEADADAAFEQAASDEGLPKADG
jgi:hypothetical protein